MAVTAMSGCAQASKSLIDLGIDGVPSKWAEWPKAVERGQLFINMSSAWGLMLSEEVVSRRQRKADLTNLEASIKATCEG
eukprot:15096118-Alexandrium_andersonii.AAC.1